MFVLKTKKQPDAGTYKIAKNWVSYTSLNCEVAFLNQLFSKGYFSEFG